MGVKFDIRRMFQPYPKKIYHHISQEENESNGLGDGESEEGLLPKDNKLRGQQETLSARSKTFFVANVACLILLIAVASTLWIRRQCGCPIIGKIPYSPLREDGVVKYISKAFYPQDIFQSETSEEVEEAWDGWEQKYDQPVLIPREKAKVKGLPESVEGWLDPGQLVYAVSVYHQMHCLNHIRKTFYADKFFPNETKEQVDFHKNHCLGLLRQTILCNGDVSLVYWWNDTFTYMDEAGEKKYSEEYLAMSRLERVRASYLKWDVSTQCQDIEAVHAWNLEHQLDNEKYTKFEDNM